MADSEQAHCRSMLDDIIHIYPYISFDEKDRFKMPVEDHSKGFKPHTSTFANASAIK